jgi:hypothetical protein
MAYILTINKSLKYQRVPVMIGIYSWVGICPNINNPLPPGTQAVLYGTKAEHQRFFVAPKRSRPVPATVTSVTNQELTSPDPAFFSLSGTGAGIIISLKGQNQPCPGVIKGMS